MRETMRVMENRMLRGTATGTLAPLWGPIVRSDGTKHLIYAGRPLYAYKRDRGSNAAKGDLENAQGGIWHLTQAQSLQ